jgi:nicotinate-nucleotide adenylyltransferase
LRVGILGGVFNPPHIGHLVCAQEAHARLELERVLLVPAGEAPHRMIEQEPGADVRLDLCRRAAGADDRLEVSAMEVDRGGPSYTVDTLRALRDRSPDDERVLILGGDQAAALTEWRDPEEVLRLATVAVAQREGTRREDVRRALDDLGGADRVSFFDMPRIDVSSTLLRARVAAGLPIRYLVPDAVADLVAERGLYRLSAPLGAG